MKRFSIPSVILFASVFMITGASLSLPEIENRLTRRLRHRSNPSRSGSAP
jgi:hypothetical protein